MTSPWLTRAQAAEYARYSEATIRRAVRAGLLVGYRVNGGRVWRFRLEDIDRWIETVRTEAHR